jgi:hypothetical protein
MPSLNDIPEHIRTSTNTATFMNWCMPLPVPTQVRQALATFWMRETGARLSSSDWDIIKKPTRLQKIPNAPSIPTPTQR